MLKNDSWRSRRRIFAEKVHTAETELGTQNFLGFQLGRRIVRSVVARSEGTVPDQRLLKFAVNVIGLKIVVPVVETYTVTETYGILPRQRLFDDAKQNTASDGRKQWKHRDCHVLEEFAIFALGLGCERQCQTGNGHSLG